MYYTVYLPILPQVRRAIILYHSLLGMYKLYYTCIHIRHVILTFDVGT